MELLSTAINSAVVVIVGVLLAWYLKGRFDGLERRMDRMEAGFDRLEMRFDSHIDRTTS